MVKGTSVNGYKRLRYLYEHIYKKKIRADKGITTKNMRYHNFAKYVPNITRQKEKEKEEWKKKHTRLFSNQRCPAQPPMFLSLNVSVEKHFRYKYYIFYLDPFSESLASYIYLNNCAHILNWYLVINDFEWEYNIRPHFSIC